MKIISVNNHNLPSALSEALAVLRKGGLIVMPTDTVYGLAAMPDNAKAIQKLFKAKKRDAGKPVAMLASGWDILAKNKIRLSKNEMKLAKRFWPGPLTLILKVGNATEGVRVPDNRIARKLIKKAGGLLRVTSANISGKAPALTASSAVRELGRTVDVYLDSGRAEIGLASSVVQIKRGRPLMIREGALSREDITRALRIS